MAKDLTPRQIRERVAYEVAEVKPKPTKRGMTAADQRNFLRKKAGWPPLRTK
jgi:hypothetical protein